VAEKLKRYRDMRDFEATPEPAGAKRKRRTRKPQFVVQEHHARRLHWDLRLEHDGVLLSWAIPKGIPPAPQPNHLAVHTEDHPLEYLDFEGEIPRGEYGAGKMIIWDRGTYDPEKIEDREVIVTLHGERVHGRYVLFRTDGDNWMIHRMDPPEDPDREPMPEHIAPMLATLSKSRPRNADDFAYEVKWDGVRAVTYVDGGQVRAESRRGNDITSRYPELRGLGPALGSTPAVLDGEIVAFDGERPSFERLQRRMHVTDARTVRRLVQEVPAVYMIFDLLWFDGHSTIALPYRDRRVLLERLELQGPSWQTPATHEDGAALLAATREVGLEGVVAKQLDSLYEPGRRSRAWLKVKNQNRQEFVIGGWLPGKGARGSTLGALLIGYYESTTPDARLRYAGRVGTGLTESELRRLVALLAERPRDTSPFDPAPRVKDARWVEPDLVAEVRFTEWTSAGVVRAPAYRGLRDDKDPRETIRET
jgi:bifunctional non-homologous end joining protein LigD